MVNATGNRGDRGPSQGRGGRGGRGGRVRGNRGRGNGDRSTGAQGMAPDAAPNMYPQSMPAVTSATQYSLDRSGTPDPAAGLGTAAPTAHAPQPNTVSYRTPSGRGDSSLPGTDLSPRAKGKSKVSIGSAGSDHLRRSAGLASGAHGMASSTNIPTATDTMSALTKQWIDEEKMSRMTLEEEEQLRSGNANEDNIQRNSQALRSKESLEALRVSATNAFKPRGKPRDERGRPFIGYSGIRISFLPRTMTDNDEKKLREFFGVENIRYSKPDPNVRSQAWIQFDSVDKAIQAYMRTEEKLLEFNRVRVGVSNDDELNPYDPPDPDAQTSKHSLSSIPDDHSTMQSASQPRVFYLKIGNIHPDRTKGDVKRDLKDLGSIPGSICIACDDDKNKGSQCAIMQFETKDAANWAKKHVASSEPIRGWKMKAGASWSD